MLRRFALLFCATTAFSLMTFAGCSQEKHAKPSESGAPSKSEPGAASKSGSAKNDSPAPAKAEPAASAKAAPEGSAKTSAAPGKAATVDAPGGLIARARLFGNPDKNLPQISPDGTKIAYIAPVKNVLNVWVGPAEAPASAQPVTNDTLRGIRMYSWAHTSNHIVYSQDKGGDENWRLYATDVNTKATKDLTPFDGTRAVVQQTSPKFRDEILVAHNKRDKHVNDIFRVNIITGQMTPVVENDGNFGDFVTDDEFNVRFATRATPDGGHEILQRTKDGKWDSFQKISTEDAMTTQPRGFNKTGTTLYMEDCRGRNTAALTAVDLATGQQTVVAEDGRCDVGAALIHPTEKTIQAVSFTYDRLTWKVVDPALAPDMIYLRTVCPGDIDVTSRSLDDKRWIVSFAQDNSPLRYFLYERNPRKNTFLFTNRDNLDGVKLAYMHPVTIKSRDGLDLIGFLSFPREMDRNGRPDHPLPLVLFVHGGPWGRDAWGFNPNHQWLANRGYAVLSVNYRGSTGFGKNFINAGNKEWAGKMHDDLIDAVDWAVKEKIADPAKVAIMGGSYGGYATLVGLTFTPEKFTCGVDIVGPSNLQTLLENAPPYWQPMMPTMTARVGDPKTEDGRRLLNERSPLNFVDKIKRPLLIGQGANDPRVKQSESDQIVKAMQAKNIPVTYVLFPDEGHGFARPANRMSFSAVAEAFLKQHLGGQCEPIGDDFKGATITAPVGADQIPGLKAALPTPQ